MTASSTSGLRDIEVDLVGAECRPNTVGTGRCFKGRQEWMGTWSRGQ